jgi:hypothetical protein
MASQTWSTNYFWSILTDMLHYCSVALPLSNSLGSGSMRRTYTIPFALAVAQGRSHTTLPTRGTHIPGPAGARDQSGRAELVCGAHRYAQSTNSVVSFMRIVRRSTSSWRASESSMSNPPVFFSVNWKKRRPKSAPAAVSAALRRRIKSSRCTSRLTRN